MTGEAGVGRRFPNRPVLAVGAIIVRGGRVLLVRRAQPPATGEWSIPGGVVELGETLEDALIREVQEETALSVTVGPVVDVVDRIYRAVDGRVEFHYVIADYLCRLVEPEAVDGKEPFRPEGKPGSDVDGVRWVEVPALSSCDVTEHLAVVVAKAVALAHAAGYW
jgi:8-oxo-dGTP diphosphatase